MTNEELVAAALTYVARGLYVFPVFEALEGGRCSCDRPDCTRIGKHPRTRGGLLDASNDPDLVRWWWSPTRPEAHPLASIGIRTGRASGLWVLDVDLGKGGDRELEELGRIHGALPPGPVSLTGGGGSHRLLAWPEGLVVKSDSDVLARGLDTRGDGGYIVAPPSSHVSGRLYAWAPGTAAAWLEGTSGLPETPPWLLARVASAPEAFREEAPGPALPPTIPSEQANAIAGRILRDAIDRVTRGAPRNDTGFWASCQLRDNRLTFVQARPVIEEYAQRVARAGPHPYALQEARKSLHQAYKAPAREPWGTSTDVNLEDDPDDGGPRGPREVTEGDELVATSDAARPIRQITDLGNAERFRDRYGDSVRYVHTWERWLCWDGTRWRQDETDEVVRLAKDTVRAIWDEARRVAGNQDRAKALAKHAIKSEASRAIASLLSLGKSEDGMGVRPEDLDRLPWLLNCANGTLDLRTGILRPHAPRELHTKLCPISYDPAAECPRWLTFLTQIMGGDPEMVAFLCRSVGYWLTGSTREQCMWILHGSGSNGKSTFLDVIRTVLADYGTTSDPKSFLERKTESISNDLAALKGSRLVVASETEAGRRLAEGLVKGITGGEPIVARFLHREFFSFTPEFKLVLCTNHKPQIRGIDHAIWRRIRLVPFTVTIPPEQKDRELKSKLLEELPGILAWAVRGCLEYLAGGLQEPAKVLEATTEYQESMDTLGSFFEECCQLGPVFKTSSKAVYAAYLAWAERSGETPVNKRQLGISLGDRGLKAFKGGGGERFWIGLRLGDGDSSGTSGSSGPQNKQVAIGTLLQDLFDSNATSATCATQCLHPTIYLDGTCATCGEKQ